MNEKAINKIFNHYNEEDREYLRSTMILLALVGAGAPETEEEFSIWCASTLKNRDERCAKEAAKAKRKEARETAKAEAAGLSREEYTARKKALSNAKRHECEARKAREEIIRLQKNIEYHERKAREYHEKAGA